MRFRRRAAEPAAERPAEAVSADTEETADAVDQGDASRSGPFDVDDIDPGERVDLGSLLIMPTSGMELRVQVDQETEAVQSVVLAGADGALEMRAFAAPRGGDLWTEVRPQIAADMTRRGGTVDEVDGPWGAELHCRLPVKRPDGTQAVQPSRMIGINGSRWLLRATLLGRPALEADAGQEWEDALAQVAVRRGSQAMPVGEALPLQLPPDARPQS